ncbi:MAG: ATP-binding protein [Verrucomicrobia bacterium]|nr:ATP-binding protein [Verrucomicrobiota bacterium]
MQISAAFKAKILTAIAENRNNFQGSDAAYAKTFTISPAIYSRMQKGEIEQVLSESKWLHIARMLDVKLNEEKWNTAKTDVFAKVQRDLKSCKENSSALILVDECGIGKTYCARHIVRSMKNSFYVDCSQTKTKQQFIRHLAKTIGCDNKGKYQDVKADLKYAILFMEQPLIVLDEAGDLDYPAFLELKELWNATEGACGWYMMGADGLRAKIERGINHRKVGYREIFDRFNNKYMKAVPMGAENKEAFYAKLIGDVLLANLPAAEQRKLNVYVKKVLATDGGEHGTLRRAKTVVNLLKKAA